VEQQDKKLKLFSAPNYHPSFQKGLHFANIVGVVHGVNKVRPEESVYLFICTYGP
jgi:hypothetical protein